MQPSPSDTAAQPDSQLQRPANSPSPTSDRPAQDSATSVPATAAGSKGPVVEFAPLPSPREHGDPPVPLYAQARTQPMEAAPPTPPREGNGVSMMPLMSPRLASLAAPASPDTSVENLCIMRKRKARRHSITTEIVFQEKVTLFLNAVLISVLSPLEGMFMSTANGKNATALSRARSLSVASQQRPFRSVPRDCRSGPPGR